MNQFGIFRGKKVLVTGHTGFKGSWLSLYLKGMGARIFGYALEPKYKSMFNAVKLDSEVENYYGDIRNFNQLSGYINDIQPEVLFHLAAQPLVTESYLAPLETIETNVLGSSNLLLIANNVESVKAVINVTSDKCYENKEWIWGYRENDELGGYDTYSASKASAEIIFSSYMNSFFNDKRGIGLASVRAGNVIGGGDWSVDRIIPDCINFLKNNEKIILRNPEATRPWQHVLEPLSGYLMLGKELYNDPIFSGSWNFGPNIKSIKTVEEVANLIIKSGC